MRFCEACIAVAEQMASFMTQEERAIFMETEYGELFNYYFSLGQWLHIHHLHESAYLYRALRILGKKSKEEMSLFLLEFAQQYFLLKRAEMI